MPSCPGWSVGSLAGHLVGVYSFWTTRLRTPAGTEAVPGKKDLERRFPGFLPWAEQDCPRDSVPDDVTSWLEEAGRDMEAAMADADPGRPTDTWFPPNQTAGFVQRRMAQETAVHRWDAQLAHGTSQPIDPDLAADGVDEMLNVHMQARRDWVTPRPGAGERYHLHRTDGPGEWLIVFEEDGPKVTPEHAKGDVAIRGSASDLLLWVWGRIPADRLELIGDTALADRWFELVPAD